MRVVLLHNPIAGAGRAAAGARRLGERLEAAGHQVQAAATRVEPVETWLEGLLEGAGALVVVGGDGAVRLASGASSRTGTPLYQVPFGTENLFARQFGMRASAEALLGALERRKVLHVDTAVAGGRPFLLMASVGIDAEIIHDLASRRRGRISHASYAAPVLRQLARWTAPALTIRADGRVVADGERGMVVVGNSRQYARRLDPALRASMTDGLLDVVFLPARTRRAVLGWALACARHRHLADARLRYHRAAELVIDCDPPRRYQLDGDRPDGAPGPARSIPITVVPASLPILAP